MKKIMNSMLAIIVGAASSLTGVWAQAQSTRWDELANLPFPGAYCTKEEAETLKDKEDREEDRGDSSFLRQWPPCLGWPDRSRWRSGRP